MYVCKSSATSPLGACHLPEMIFVLNHLLDLQRLHHARRSYKIIPYLSRFFFLLESRWWLKRGGRSGPVKQKINSRWRVTGRPAQHLTRNANLRWFTSLRTCDICRHQKNICFYCLLFITRFRLSNLLAYIILLNIVVACLRALLRVLHEKLRFISRYSSGQ